MGLLPRFFATCIIVALGFLAGALTHSAESALRVSAAASLSESLTQIGAEFTKVTGSAVELNLGASSALARQIEEGAPADVFFSADPAKMNALAARELIVLETRKDQLSNSLVVVVPVDSALKLASIHDLGSYRVRKVATGNPGAVPVGVYAKTYLKNAGIWKDLVGKVVAMENVRAALAAVESGNVDVGIVYKTDAAISRKVKVVLEFPPRDEPKIIYPVAVVKGSAQLKLAAKYLEFLDSPDAKSIFEKYGFIVIHK